MNNKRFLTAFQITKTIIFEVDYGAITSNKSWHFSTSAAEFIKSKRDFCRCGQAQKDLLPQGSKARNFFSKWDKYHLQNLTARQYADMLKDLDELKRVYNYIEKDETHPTHYISFGQLKDLSMQKVAA